MKLSEMFPSKYVRGEDLQGRAVAVTIARIVAENMRPSAQSPEVTKYVLYTVEGKKGVVLSKVLAGQIASALGSDDTDHWPGKRITLYPEALVVAGTPRVAVRARAAAAPQPPNGNGKPKDDF